MFSVYVLRNSISNKIYIGQTNNLEERLKQHNGETLIQKKSYTHKQRSEGTWICVYIENFETRKDAMRREKQLKSSKGSNFINNLLTSSQ